MSGPNSALVGTTRKQKKDSKKGPIVLKKILLAAIKLKSHSDVSTTPPLKHVVEKKFRGIRDPGNMPNTTNVVE